MVKIETLRKSLAAKVYDQLPLVIERFNITSNLELAHFLAQVHHESGGFKSTVESLNYTKVDRILDIFKRHFDNDKNKVISKAEFNIACSFISNPEGLANHVYCNRLGNGDEASGDGWLFRGRGYIQLTGRANYEAFAKFITEDDILGNPDLVASKYPLSSAGWFWDANNIHTSANAGSMRANVREVTKHINPALAGLPQREALFKQYHSILD